VSNAPREKSAYPPLCPVDRTADREHGVQRHQSLDEPPRVLPVSDDDCSPLRSPRRAACSNAESKWRTRNVSLVSG
jgi:hypothetical protein